LLSTFRLHVGSLHQDLDFQYMQIFTLRTVCDHNLPALTHCYKSVVFYITARAIALHCCKAHAKINRKMGNSTPCKIVTHENLNMKLSRHDYVVDITHQWLLVVSCCYSLLALK